MDERTAPCREGRCLPLRSGARRWSDFSAVKFSCTGVFGGAGEASGGQAAHCGRTRSSRMLNGILLVTFLVPASGEAGVRLLRVAKLADTKSDRQPGRPRRALTP